VAHADRIEPELFGYLADTLANRALGLQKPSEAGWILTEWFKRDPSWELANRAVEAWRWGMHSDQALKVLSQAKNAGLKGEGEPVNLDHLRVKLALESNQPNLAFDIEMERYPKASESERPALLRRLVELAGSGDRTTEASKLIAEHLRTVLFHNCPLNQAIALARSGKAFASASDETCYRDYASAMARWQEWSNQGAVAIDTWLRLAMLDHQEAWGRCQDLYQDVLRTEDFARVLAYRIERGLSLEKQSLLADLLAEEGSTDEALKHYQAVAASATNPVDALRPMARIHQQSGNWEQSLATFDEVLRYAPADLEAGKGRAFALVRLHKYDAAREAYLSLSRTHMEDAELQETCATVCDSLGCAADAREAVQRLLACSSHESTAEEHLELADRFRVGGDQTLLAQTLRTGLARFPASTRLRFSLAEAVAAQGLHDEAIRVLAHESLRNQPAAMDLLISEAMEVTDSTLATTFLGAEVPSCLAGLPASQLRMAFLYDHSGRPLVGTTIVNDLLHNSAFRQTNAWLALGRLSLDFGYSDRAESFITLYLASSGSSDSKAWELLGDIYQEQDRTTEALTAYRKAVEVLSPVTTTKPEATSLKVSQAASPALQVR